MSLLVQSYCASARSSAASHRKGSIVAIKKRSVNARRLSYAMFAMIQVLVLQVGLTSPVSANSCSTSERSSTVTYRPDSYTEFKQTVWYKLEGYCAGGQFSPQETKVTRIWARVEIQDPGGSGSRFTRFLGYPQVKKQYSGPYAWASDTYGSDGTFPIVITRNHYPNDGAGVRIPYDRDYNTVSFYCDCELLIASSYSGFRVWHYFIKGTKAVEVFGGPQ
jgi:hypothetical protein